MSRGKANLLCLSLIAVCLASSYAKAADSVGLVGYWPFDNTIFQNVVFYARFLF